MREQSRSSQADITLDLVPLSRIYATIRERSDIPTSVPAWPRLPQPRALGTSPPATTFPGRHRPLGPFTRSYPLTTDRAQSWQCGDPRPRAGTPYRVIVFADAVRLLLPRRATASLRPTSSSTPR